MISLNSHYVGIVYPIGLSFGTFVADYHNNVHEQLNMFSLGIRGAKSWPKSVNFMIFAIFFIAGNISYSIFKPVTIYTELQKSKGSPSFKLSFPDFVTFTFVPVLHAAAERRRRRR